MQALTKLSIFSHNEQKEPFDIEAIMSGTKVTLNPSVNGAPLSVVATTPRLILRFVNEEDVPFYRDKLWGDPEVMKYFGNGEVRLYKDKASEEAKNANYAQWRIVDSETPRSWVKRYERDNNPFTGYTVEIIETGERIGHVIVAGELAFMFKKNFNNPKQGASDKDKCVWGHRYASEAVVALTRVVLPFLYQNEYKDPASDKDSKYITATVHPEQIAGQEVLKRCGFSVENVVVMRKFGDKEFPRHEAKIPIVDLKEKYDTVARIPNNFCEEERYPSLKLS